MAEYSWTQSLEDISATVAQTYDIIAPIYTDKHFGDPALLDPLRACCAFLQSHGARRVLAIGCGPGWEVQFLMDQGFEVVGIDASQELIEIAQLRVPRGDFQRMFLQKLEFRQESFDAIWCARTLIHVPSPFIVDALAEWKRVLKANGVVALVVKVGEGEGWEPEEYDPSGRSHMFYKRFSGRELEESLDAAGYDVLQSELIPEKNYWYILGQKRDTVPDIPVLDRHIQEEQYEMAISVLLRAGMLSDKACANLCVFYDKLSTQHRDDPRLLRVTAEKLRIHLQTPRTLHSDMFGVWFVLGWLHLKLSEFGGAVECFERALELKPEDFGSLLRLGYAYEGLKQFDRAIQAAKKAEAIALSAKGNFPQKDIAELYHAIGHFYIGRSYIDRGGDISLEDRDLGDEYMSRAVEIDKAYVSCRASTHTETKRYRQAIRIIDEALADPDIQQDPVLYNELFFYRGDAHLGAEEYEKALADFKRVEEYAVESRDSDALAHVKQYQVRTELKRRSIDELGTDQITEYLEILCEYQPSPYVMRSFRADHQRLISSLKALNILKEYLLGQHQQEPELLLEEVITNLERIMIGQPKLDLLVFTNDERLEHHLIQYRYMETHILPLLDVALFRHEVELPDRYPVWLVVVHEDTSRDEALTQVAYYIGRYSQQYTIIVCDPGRIIPLSNTELGVLHVTFWDRAILITQFALLYDKVKQFLGRSETPLGMAPIGVAPSLLAAQTGNVPLLPMA